MNDGSKREHKGEKSESEIKKSSNSTSPPAKEKAVIVEGETSTSPPGKETMVVVDGENYNSTPKKSSNNASPPEKENMEVEDATDTAVPSKEQKKSGAPGAVEEKSPTDAPSLQFSDDFIQEESNPKVTQKQEEIEDQGGSNSASVALEEEQRTPKPTSRATEKPYFAGDDDPIKVEDEVFAEQEEVQDLQEELHQEEKVARRAGGLGIFIGIMAMIFTAHQMSENPDGIYASVCRLAITISTVIVKIVCMPCRKLIGAGNPHYNGHMPISTSDYSYRSDPYRSSANAGFELS